MPDGPQAGGYDPCAVNPPANSTHQNYFLWGPRDYTGESMIILDDTQETLEKICTHVKKVAHFEHPYSMPHQHFDIFYCQGMRPPLNVLWPTIKHWN